MVAVNAELTTKAEGGVAAEELLVDESAVWGPGFEGAVLHGALLHGAVLQWATIDCLNRTFTDLKLQHRWPILFQNLLLFLLFM